MTLNIQGLILNLQYFKKNCLIATKQKQNMSNECQVSKVAFRLYLGHDLELEFSRSNIELLYHEKMLWLP